MLMKNLCLPAASVMVLFIMTLRASRAAISAGVTVEDRAALSGRHYLLIHPNSYKIDFDIARPSQQNDNVLLCIPAAFTSSTGGICGLYACRGEVSNSKSIDKGMSGAIQFLAGTCKIFDTRNGASLDDDFIKQLKSSKSSFFQQFQIVKNGHAEGFKDKSHLQRRCIATFASQECAVIESQDNVSFQEFAEDLLSFGAENAIYTDMGPYGGGWYRDAKDHEIISIGKNHSMTNSQTNWVVIEKVLPK
jgi:hypothetical protein